MKVAQFSFEYPPSTTGGLGTYLQGLVEYQRHVGDRVDVFFLGDGQPPDGTIPLPFYPNGTLMPYSLPYINQLTDMTQYDVVVCQDWAGILAARALWRRTASLVMTCHLPLAWDLGYYEDLPCQFAGELEFFALAQADLILAVSESVKQHLEATFTFLKGKIRVIPNGTDTSFFCPDPQVERSTVLYVGRFFEQKGADLIPSIFAAVKKRYPTQHFTVIGTGPLKESILKDFDELGFMDSLTFLDFSPLETVLELYRKAKVVIMPSRREPFGLVATESMATGTPLIASSVGGLKEILTDGVDGFLVEPECADGTPNIDGYVDAICAILENEQLAARIGAAGRQAAVDKFDQRLCLERTRQAYIDASQLE